MKNLKIVSNSDYNEIINKITTYAEKIENDLKTDVNVFLRFKGLTVDLLIPKKPSKITKQVAKALGHKVKENGVMISVSAKNLEELPQKLAESYREFREVLNKVYIEVNKKS